MEIFQYNNNNNNNNNNRLLLSTVSNIMINEVF